MRDNSFDRTIERNYVQKWRFLIQEYEAVKAGRSEHFASVGAFYRHHGTCSQTFRKYYNRYLQGGREEDLLPQRRGPKWKSRRFPAEIAALVLEQRRLGMNRYEIYAVLRERMDPAPSLSTIYRLLRDHGLNRRTQPMIEEKRRIQKDRLGELGHIDLHQLPRDLFLSPPGQTCHVISLIDSCSRLAWAEVVAGKKALPVMFKTLKMLNTLHHRYGLVLEALLTDNGAEFAARKNPEEHPFEAMSPRWASPIAIPGPIARRPTACPREGVWSWMIVEGLDWGQVVETFEPGSIVVVDEAQEEGVAIGMGSEEPVRAAAFGLLGYGFGDAAVEAFDQAIGLRLVGLGEPVLDLALGAQAIKGVFARGPIARLVLLIDCEAVGELAAIVGEDGVDAMGEVRQEAFEEALGGLALAIGMDLQIDVAGRAIDRHEGIALALLQGGQVLEIDVNEADGRRLEAADRGLFGPRALIEAVPNQAAMDGVARQRAVDAPAHHLGDVVERQAQLGAQLADQLLLKPRQADGQALGRVGAIVHALAPAPATDRRFADPELGGEGGDRLAAGLNGGADLGRGGGVGVQLQVHDRRSRR